MVEKFYNTAATAKILGVSERTIRRRCVSGELKAFKLDGKAWLVPADQVDKDFVKIYPLTPGESFKSTGTKKHVKFSDVKDAPEDAFPDEVPEIGTVNMQYVSGDQINELKSKQFIQAKDASNVNHTDFMKEFFKLVKEKAGKTVYFSSKNRAGYFAEVARKGYIGEAYRALERLRTNNIKNETSRKK